MIENICRCCFAEFPRLSYNLFEDGLLSEFSECLPSLKIAPNDGLPNIICDLCLLKLRESVDFHRKCIKTDLELREIIAKEKAENKTNEDGGAKSEESLSITNLDVNNNYNEGMWNYDEILMLSDDVFSVNFAPSDDSIDVLLRTIPIATPSELNFLTCSSESSSESTSEKSPSASTNEDLADNNENLPKTRRKVRKSQGRANSSHQCNFCEKKFTRKFQLKLHLKSVHRVGEGLRYNCTECSKEFASLHSLKYHRKSLHSKERPFACSHCDKSFVLRSQLTSHMRIHSDGGKPRIHECLHCGKLWPTKSDLKTHLRSHDPDLERPKKCSKCDKSFFTQGHLNSHMLVHTGEKPFTCQFCQKTYQSLGNLNNHIRRRHKKIIV